MSINKFIVKIKKRLESIIYSIRLFFRKSKRTHINYFLQSANRADIKSTMLSVAWAAGPITVVALSIGYYLAYGSLVPSTTIIYFSCYAFFVGTGGFLTKVFLDAKTFSKSEEQLETLLDVIDKSYENIYQARRSRLSILDDDMQKEETASYLLSKSHPTNIEIHYAFSLYFNKNIADFAEILWVHDSNSLPIDNDENRDKLKSCYKEIDKSEKLSGDTITAPPKSGCGTLILPHL
jgi:hypothetical protein